MTKLLPCAAAAAMLVTLAGCATNPFAPKPAADPVEPYEVINKIGQEVKVFNHYLSEHPMKVAIADPTTGCQKAPPAKPGAPAPAGAASGVTTKTMTPTKATLTLKAVATKVRDGQAGFTGLGAGTVALDLGYESKSTTAKTQTIEYDFDTALPKPDAPKALAATAHVAPPAETARARSFVERLEKQPEALQALKEAKGVQTDEDLISKLADEMVQQAEEFKGYEVASMAYAALSQLALVHARKDACLFNPSIKATIEFDATREKDINGALTILVFKVGDTETRSNERDNSLEIDFELQ